MHKFKTLPALVLALSLAGCAHTLTKSDCMNADPYQVGVNDGGQGKTADQFDTFRTNCAGKDVDVSSDRYDYGRKVGLARYCSDERAKEDAESGKADSVCLKEAVPPYQAAYQQALGDKKNKQQAELDDIKKTQEQLKKKQERIQGSLDQTQGNIDSNAGK